jgi:hypothetical protein
MRLRTSRLSELPIFPAVQRDYFQRGETAEAVSGEGATDLGFGLGAEVAALAPAVLASRHKLIVFLSDERVQIWVGSRPETRNYAEMGFNNKKNGAPVLAWQTLRAIAESKGSISVASDNKNWAYVEKRIQEIRKALRRLFSLTDDPLPYVKKTQPGVEFGYCAQFNIVCGPSYES